MHGNVELAAEVPNPKASLSGEGTHLNCRVVFSLSGNIAKRKTGKITEIS
jgi:hypothetical protein